VQSNVFSHFYGIVNPSFNLLFLLGYIVSVFVCVSPYTVFCLCGE